MEKLPQNNVENIKNAEKSPERIPSKEEVLKIFNKYIEGLEIVSQRDLLDEKGLCFWEVVVKDKESGDNIEYNYVRKGNKSATTEIHFTSYGSDGIPCGGNNLLVVNETTGEWEDPKPWKGSK